MINYSQESGDWFENILISAIEKRASDIHFEPERDELNVRFRIDGILQFSESLNKYSQENIISKIKVLSNMNITEHRLPQDGHFEFGHKDRVHSIRVSTLPGLYGETIVMRILNREDILIKLDNLGFLPEQLDLINKLITSSSGLILVTGPTGSGKTNLLYSILNTLNNPTKNIITLEDPIEYQMQHVRQTQINESMGLSYSKAMRSVVRQDPDIVMLGEIRDVDTSQIAIQASLTGILIFSTFHTFDVPALVTRFLEFGVSNSIIAQAVKGVVSTRLLRTICNFCRFGTTLSVQKGKGCGKCSNTGYLGRTGVFEVVYLDEEIQTGIIEHQPASSIREINKRKKIKSMREVALEKVASGITTIDEVVRVLGQEIE